MKFAPHNQVNLLFILFMVISSIYFAIKLVFFELYTGYVCYKALKSEDPSQLRALLTYCVVIITFIAAEQLADLVLFCEIKLLLLMWLMLPQTKGAAVVYTEYLAPFLTKNESHIDGALIELQSQLKQSALGYVRRFLQSLKSFLTDLLSKPSDADAETNPPLTPEKSVWAIDPYTIFSSLIRTSSTGAQDNASVSADTSSDEVKLERVDSSDSLSSGVMVSGDPPNTWGAYLYSWVPKYPTKRETKQD